MRPVEPAVASNRMRRLATALLIVMLAVLILANVFLSVHTSVGYVRAFAEAAVVGALADWFAITALFRQPLGLPIPHTAIIPRNKDRTAGIGTHHDLTRGTAGRISCTLSAARSHEPLSLRLPRTFQRKMPLHA